MITFTIGSSCLWLNSFQLFNDRKQKIHFINTTSSDLTAECDICLVGISCGFNFHFLYNELPRGTSIQITYTHFARRHNCRSLGQTHLCSSSDNSPISEAFLCISWATLGRRQGNNTIQSYSSDPNEQSSWFMSKEISRGRRSRYKSLLNCSTASVFPWRCFSQINSVKNLALTISHLQTKSCRTFLP